MNEALAIENHVFGLELAENRLLFEAKLLIDPTLQEKVTAQKQVYHLVKQYGRKQLKAELEAVHLQIFTAAAHRPFAQRVRSLFGK